MPMPPSAPTARTPSRRTLRGIRRDVLAWYAARHRDFPWRGTTDPYAVLVSEVMLQQTQALRVEERYVRFLRRFPSAAALAAAPERAVLAEWSGLGYNRRALALRRAAIAVTADGWPRTVAGLERLPGVGPYTARAVASLAFGVPVGVVDTNVRRWLVRRLRPERAPRELQRLSDALATADPDVGSDEVAAWTHATMEFGATVCRARDPACGTCPIARGCPSRGRGVVVPVTRQPAFAGSRRALRGAILRRLVASPDHAAPLDLLGTVVADGAPIEATLGSAIASLERDGLAHRADGVLRLGPEPRAPAPPAGTIGA